MTWRATVLFPKPRRLWPSSFFYLGVLSLRQESKVSFIGTSSARKLLPWLWQRDRAAHIPLHTMSDSFQSFIIACGVRLIADVVTCARLASAKKKGQICNEKASGFAAEDSRCSRLMRASSRAAEVLGFRSGRENGGVTQLWFVTKKGTKNPLAQTWTRSTDKSTMYNDPTGHTRQFYICKMTNKCHPSTSSPRLDTRN